MQSKEAGLEENSEKTGYIPCSCLTNRRQ